MASGLSVVVGGRGEDGEGVLCLRFDVLGLMVVVVVVFSGGGSGEEDKEELEEEALGEALFGKGFVGEVGWRVTLESVDAFEEGSAGLGGTGFSESWPFAFGFFFKGFLVVFEDFLGFGASDSLPDDDDEEEEDDELDEDPPDGDFGTAKFAPSDSSSLSASLSDVCGELDGDFVLIFFVTGFCRGSVLSILIFELPSSLLPSLLLVSSVLVMAS